jgi:hypothetical protein
MENLGIPEKAIEGIKDSVDCNIHIFDNTVSMNTMYLYLIGTTVLLVGIYILMNLKKKRVN